MSAGREGLYPGVEFAPNDLCPIRDPSGHQGAEDCRGRFWQRVGEAHGEGEPEAAEPYAVFACTRCGIGFTDPMATEATTPALYDDRTSRDFQAEETRAIRTIRRVLARRDIRGLVAQAGLGREPGAVLDYACGSGTWSLALAEAMPGARVTATDFHPEPPAQLEGSTAVRYVGYDEAMGGALDGSFDLILARHVLEHVHRPVETVRRLGRLLAPGGVLISEVPAFETPLRRLFGAHWEFFYAPFHPVHYTAGAIGEVMAQAGLEVVRVAPSEMPLMGRNLQNVLRRPDYGRGLLVAGLMLHPVQLLIGKATGTAVCLRAWARRPA
jgi:SAM-dependent methyltransferase